MQDPNDSHTDSTKAAKPAPKRTARKGAPPPPNDTLGALGQDGSPHAKKRKNKEEPAKAAGKQRTEPLNFRVNPDFRRAFKRAAAAQDCKKVELLERIFTEWSARNPA
jgi:hypothetical protein